MKRIIVKLLPFAALFTGIFLILYPTVSNHINAMHQSRAIQAYNDISDSLSTEQHDDILEAAERYNRQLSKAKDPILDPACVSGYDDTLDITGTGIMGYLTIEKLNVELPIYHSVDEDILQVAAGHLPGTSLPVGGESTHSVISGHRGLPRARLFTDLDKMELGDIFCITIMSEVLTYQVDQIKTVKPYEIDDLGIESGKDYCTLFTCTPYGINSHRLLIRGVRIETQEEYKVYVSNDALIISPLIAASVIAVPILLVLFIILLIKGRKKPEN